MGCRHLVVMICSISLISGCATVDPWADTRIESEVKARLVAEHDANLTRLGVVSKERLSISVGRWNQRSKRRKPRRSARTAPGVKRASSARIEVRSRPGSAHALRAASNLVTGIAKRAKNPVVGPGQA